MDYLHKIDATAGVATVQLGGVITGNGLTEACASLFLDKDWKPQLHHVWDIRSVIRFSLDGNDVEAIKLLFNSVKGEHATEIGRIAIVLSGRISDFLVEAGDLLMELCRRPVTFFSEVEEVDGWLTC